MNDTRNKIDTPCSRHHNVNRKRSPDYLGHSIDWKLHMVFCPGLLDWMDSDSMHVLQRNVLV